ncbi:methyl-accepting chemotaxis protein [Rhizobacter sp. Root1221]|uniref:MCP four helix bundle domain-containing protein n=1 Tax=Rhizobacter sp. Root1221 TaxID=1736433 RepID=UPI0006F82F54|nr:methyl-accepting chemotaxis protein [Rhizobacter sp. Root1221]KQV97523.1 hypothetical protein ASC87_22925 [Rhizobacter sp. Root1221]
MHTTSGVQRAAAIARSSDPSLVAYFAGATASSVARTTELQKLIEQHMNLPDEVALFEKVGNLRKDYLAARQTVGDLKKSGDAEGASKAFAEQFEPRSTAYLAGVRELVDSQQKQSGTKLVHEAGSTMGEIVASVQRVTDIIGEISAAAHEQSMGLGAVNGAVNELDQMTQQNAALVEESSAAAESLKDQAVKLSGAVGTFRLGA